jgi:hypothetical protein
LGEGLGTKGFSLLAAVERELAKPMTGADLRRRESGLKMKTRKKLIEVALPLEAINVASAGEIETFGIGQMVSGQVPRKRELRHTNEVPPIFWTVAK